MIKKYANPTYDPICVYYIHNVINMLIQTIAAHIVSSKSCHILFVMNMEQRRAVSSNFIGSLEFINPGTKKRACVTFASWFYLQILPGILGLDHSRISVAKLNRFDWNGSGASVCERNSRLCRLYRLSTWNICFHRWKSSRCLDWLHSVTCLIETSLFVVITYVEFD